MDRDRDRDRDRDEWRYRDAPGRFPQSSPWSRPPRAFPPGGSDRARTPSPGPGPGGYRDARDRDEPRGRDSFRPAPGPADVRDRLDLESSFRGPPAPWRGPRDQRDSRDWERERERDRDRRWSGRDDRAADDRALPPRRISPTKQPFRDRPMSPSRNRPFPPVTPRTFPDARPGTGPSTGPFTAPRDRDERDRDRDRDRDRERRPDQHRPFQPRDLTRDLERARADSGSDQLTSTRSSPGATASAPTRLMRGSSSPVETRHPQNRAEPVTPAPAAASAPPNPSSADSAKPKPAVAAKEEPEEGELEEGEVLSPVRPVRVYANPPPPDRGDDRPRGSWQRSWSRDRQDRDRVVSRDRDRERWTGPPPPRRRSPSPGLRPFARDARDQGWAGRRRVSAEERSVGQASGSGEVKVEPGVQDAGHRTELQTEDRPATPPLPAEQSAPVEARFGVSDAAAEADSRPATPALAPLVLSGGQGADRRSSDAMQRQGETGIQSTPPAVDARPETPEPIAKPASASPRVAATKSPLPTLLRQKESPPAPLDVPASQQAEVAAAMEPINTAVTPPSDTPLAPSASPAVYDRDALPPPPSSPPASLAEISAGPIDPDTAPIHRLPERRSPIKQTLAERRAINLPPTHAPLSSPFGERLRDPLPTNGSMHESTDTEVWGAPQDEDALSEASEGAKQANLFATIKGAQNGVRGLDVDDIVAWNVAAAPTPSRRVQPKLDPEEREEQLRSMARKLDDGHRGVSRVVAMQVAKEQARNTARVLALRAEYSQLDEEWQEHCQFLDDLMEKRGPPPESLYAMPNALPAVTPGPQPTTPITEDMGGRARRRGVGDAVTTEAEFQEILAAMADTAARDPNYRASKTTAVVPDMLTPAERRLYYADDNDVVDDPIAYYDFRGIAEETWTDEERAIFLRRYLSNPKQFGKIAEQLPNKSASDCVLYYYRTKKEVDYKGMLAARRGLGTLKRKVPPIIKKGGKSAALLANLDQKKPTVRDSPAGKNVGAAGSGARGGSVALDGERERDKGDKDKVKRGRKPDGTAKRRANAAGLATLVEGEDLTSRDGSEVPGVGALAGVKKGSRGKGKRPRMSSALSGFTDGAAMEGGTPVSDAGLTAEQVRVLSTAQAQAQADLLPPVKRRKHRRHDVPPSEAGLEGEVPEPAMGEAAPGYGLLGTPAGDKDKEKEKEKATRRSTTSSYWSVAEKDRVRELALLHRTDYKAIAAHFPDKSERQIMNYVLAHAAELGLEGVQETAEKPSHPFSRSIYDVYAQSTLGGGPRLGVFPSPAERYSQPPPHASSEHPHAHSHPHPHAHAHAQGHGQAYARDGAGPAPALQASPARAISRPGGMRISALLNDEPEPMDNARALLPPPPPPAVDNTDAQSDVTEDQDGALGVRPSPRGLPPVPVPSRRAGSFSQPHPYPHAHPHAHSHPHPHPHSHSHAQPPPHAEYRSDGHAYSYPPVREREHEHGYGRGPHSRGYSPPPPPPPRRLNADTYDRMAQVHHQPHHVSPQPLSAMPAAPPPSRAQSGTPAPAPASGSASAPGRSLSPVQATQGAAGYHYAYPPIPGHAHAQGHAHPQAPAPAHGYASHVRGEYERVERGREMDRERGRDKDGDRDRDRDREMGEWRYASPGPGRPAQAQPQPHAQAPGSHLRAPSPHAHPSSYAHPHPHAHAHAQHAAPPPRHVYSPQYHPLAHGHGTPTPPPPPGAAPPGSSQVRSHSHSRSPHHSHALPQAYAHGHGHGHGHGQTQSRPSISPNASHAVPRPAQPMQTAGYAHSSAHAPSRSPPLPEGQYAHAQAHFGDGRVESSGGEGEARREGERETLPSLSRVLDGSR